MIKPGGTEPENRELGQQFRETLIRTYEVNKGYEDGLHLFMEIYIESIAHLDINVRDDLIREIANITAERILREHIHLRESGKRAHRQETESNSKREKIPITNSQSAASELEEQVNQMITASREGHHIAPPGIVLAEFTSTQQNSPPEQKEQLAKDLSVETNIHLRLNEEPLQLSTLNTTLAALTELSTKCWLIAQGRFVDLQEYTQTHASHFERETGITIGKVSHNSPFDINLNVSATNMAEAIGTAIDSMAQTRKRFALKELEVMTQAQQLQQKVQQAEHEQEMAELEREKQQLAIEQQRLEIEQQRLEILGQRLEAQKQSVETAIGIAELLVEKLQPKLDPNARAMAMQTLLPNILQLQGIDLTLILPPTKAVDETIDQADGTIQPEANERGDRESEK